MAADSWHQPDSMEQKLHTMRKESNTERELSEQYVYECLQNDTEKVSIHMLNDDCLKHIFLFLSIVDRVRVERVCKRWRYLSQDSWHMVKTLDLSRFTWGFSQIDPYAQFLPSIVHKILPKCGKFLTRINISDEVYYVTNRTFTIIGRLCPNVTTIDITTCHVQALKKLKNLKHLAIKQCNDVATHTFQVVGQHCKNLNTLELDGNFPSAQTADMMYLIHLVNLQVLKIANNLKVSDDFLIDLVQRCQQLSNIDITGCSNVSDAGLTAIATLIRLEKLTVSYMRRITDDGLKNVRGIKELVCHGCLFSDRGMITFIESSPQLQLLDLSGCDYITENTLDVAKDVCSSRTNNVMLKMIVGKKTRLTEKKMVQEKLLRYYI